MQSLGSNDSLEAETIQPLTFQQAEALKTKLKSVSLEAFLMRVLVSQLFAAVSIAVLAGSLWGSMAVAVSSFYGAMCAALPTALVVFVMVRRMSSSVVKRPGDMLLGLFVLELIKVAASVLLLVAAPVVLETPQWVALVVGFVLTLKIYWLVALVGLRRTAAVHTLG